MRPLAERRPRADIVGAGVAGLATAVGLHRGGWSVRVFDRAPRSGDTGGGLGVTPNGLRALDWLGVGDRARALSIDQAAGGVRRPDGRWIARRRLGLVVDRYGDGVRAMLRGELLALLETALPAGTVRHRRVVTGLDPGDGRRAATLVGPDEAAPRDLLVLADGARSLLRGLLMPEHRGLRSVGCVSWRALSTGAPAAEVDPAETWGAGERVALLPLPDGRVHCSMMVADGGERFVGQAPSDVLRDRFGCWHEPIPALLDCIDADALFFDEIVELAGPLPRRHRGRTVLVGDAAHAMTPNVGAANLALEDAVELTARLHRVAAEDPLDDALNAYGRSRRRRTESLARLSRRVGRVALWRSPIATAARNGLARAGGLAPESLTARSLDPMFAWSPPDLSPIATPPTPDHTARPATHRSIP